MPDYPKVSLSVEGRTTRIEGDEDGLKTLEALIRTARKQGISAARGRDGRDTIIYRLDTGGGSDAAAQDA